MFDVQIIPPNGFCHPLASMRTSRANEAIRAILEFFDHTIFSINSILITQNPVCNLEEPSRHLFFTALQILKSIGHIFNSEEYLIWATRSEHLDKNLNHVCHWHRPSVRCEWLKIAELRPLCHKSTSSAHPPSKRYHLLIHHLRGCEYTKIAIYIFAIKPASSAHPPPLTAAWFSRQP